MLLFLLSLRIRKRFVFFFILIEKIGEPDRAFVLTTSIN